MASSSNNAVAVNGGPPSVDLVYFLPVSPGWFETMRMRIMAGREFLLGDVNPGASVVNQTFVKRFFNGENPVGRYFEEVGDDGLRQHFLVVGVAVDAPYRSVREAQLPVAFVPLHEVDAKAVVQPEDSTTFLVRMAGNDPTAPMARAGELRKAVAAAGAGIRVSNARAQQELIDGQTVRERLLAMLGVFFASVALLLAGIGLYGVLNYSVLQRRREIGIRMAIGARHSRIAWLVTADVFQMVVIGGAAGWVLGMVSTRYVESLLYQVKAAEPDIAALPALAILSVAIVAILPAISRAMRIEPAEILRSE
jgi:predicted lysophospholipase L1 biosynthesis ABC-type transport system permease subunit